MDYKAVAQNVLTKVGGAGNVENVYHCATRLRFTLKSSENVKTDELKSAEGVLNVLGGGIQIQVVIGPNVNKVFNELTPMLPGMEGGKTADEPAEGEKGKLFDKVVNAISSACF